jgi:ubiquinone/menaquinone biosynthesis C-methylase UbiE
MGQTNIHFYRRAKDLIRENLAKYTRKAFGMLPLKIKNPKILDPGCGTGVPAMELARLTTGKITGIDTDTASLELFREKIMTSGFTDRIQLMNRSVKKITFPEESFDIIWAEGSVFIMGFENSIAGWSRFLKPGGFLAIHDENKHKNEKSSIIQRYGYSLVGQFDLPAKCWWNEYFIPLESLIKKYREKRPDDPVLRNQLDEDQSAIDLGRTDPDSISSFFIILQKTARPPGVTRDAEKRPGKNRGYSLR